MCIVEEGDTKSGSTERALRRYQLLCILGVGRGKSEQIKAYNHSQKRHL
jgi:hypothetical protein